ncbi:MAG: peptidylprolyl isomerase [Pseudomonadota bacterium]
MSPLIRLSSRLSSRISATLLLASLLPVISLTACSAEPSATPATPATPETPETPANAVPAAGPAPAAATPAVAAVVQPLNPLPGLEAQVPVITDKEVIRMQTSAGDVVIEVYPQAAPNAVQRFVELVQSGFYDNTPVSRVVPGFVAQFGINWREPHKTWEENTFADDPTLFALERGTLAFAKGGIDNNSTQVFINYAENNRLAARQYNFTTFGKVVSGMEVVDMFLDIGEPGMGLDQERLWQDGEAYLASLELKPTMILHAEVVAAEPAK